MTHDQIREAAIRYGEAAIAISREKLGEDAWRDLSEWVESYVVTSAVQWAIDKSREQPL